MTRSSSTMMVTGEIDECKWERVPSLEGSGAVWIRLRIAEPKSFAGSYFNMEFPKSQARTVRDGFQGLINDLDQIIAQQTHDELLEATGHGGLAQPGDS